MMTQSPTRARRVMHRCAATIAAAAAAMLALSASAQPSPGPDVVYTDMTSASIYGPVGDLRAYALGTSTCNRGDQDLLWLPDGTPAVASNLYRLHDGRLLHLGMSWVKVASFASLFGSCIAEGCNGGSGFILGAGCIDVYTSSWNAQQTRLAPRSAVNPWTGAIGPLTGGTFSPIDRRLQVRTDDITLASFPGALYFAEGVYVATDEHGVNGNLNKLNNASHKQISLNQTTYQLTFPIGAAMQVGRPAIYAWRDHGLGQDTPDPAVTIQHLDVPDEGRFYIASKVTENGDGTWRYQYAVFNQNSDLAAASWRIPLRPGTQVEGVGFHAPPHHSGEVYSDAPWVVSTSGNAVRWATPATFAQDPATSALRWAMMHTFWFDADRPPAPAAAELGLFKAAQTALATTVPAPTGGCWADWNNDGLVNSGDITAFLATWIQEVQGAGTQSDFNGDGAVNSGDITAFLTRWLAEVTGGC